MNNGLKVAQPQQVRWTTWGLHRGSSGPAPECPRPHTVDTGGTEKIHGERELSKVKQPQAVTRPAQVKTGLLCADLSPSAQALGKVFQNGMAACKAVGK